MLQASPTDQAARRRQLPGGALPDLALITLLGFLFLSPVLISPHFGLFSDYDQILRWPASSLHHLRQFANDLRPLGDGRWTPLFHLVTVALYALVGPHAFLFFLAQGLTLVASLVMVYLLVRWMADGSRAAGIAACLLILVSAPLTENYFTLDKVEPRVVFFSLLSLGYFAWRLREPREGLYKAALIHFAVAVLLIFSKETGAFLVPVAFLALCAALLRTPKDSRMVRESAVYFGSTAAVLLLFLALNQVLLQGDAKLLRAQNGGVGRYLTYDISPRLVAANLVGYLGTMPEVAGAILLFAGWLLWALLRRRNRSWDASQLLLFAIGTSGAIYLAGMLLWRFTLLYYMLPVAVFFAMASMAVVFRQQGNWRGWVCFFVLLLTAAVHFDARWRTGWAILAQDRAKDEIIQAIQKHASGHTHVAMGMFDVRSAEIGRSLQMYLGLNGVHVTEGPPGDGLRVYNLVEGPWIDFSDTHRYDGSAAEPPTAEEMNQARALASPYVLWQYAPKRLMHRVWWTEKLAAGDLLALPVGAPSNQTVQARGVAAFSESAQDTLAVRFMGVGTRRLESAVVAAPFDKNQYLGWELYEVTEAPQASIYRGLDRLGADATSASLGSGWSAMGWTPAREPYRWGYNAAQIFGARNAALKVTLDLEPNGKLGLPMAIRAVDSKGRKVAEWPLQGRLKVELQIPKGETITLRVPESVKVAPDTICFRLFGIR